MNGSEKMSDDDVAKYFDHHDGQEDGAVSDPMEDQRPCSSKCNNDDDLLMAGDSAFPSDPIGSSTADGGAMKRKPSEAEGGTGSKRVRIASPPSDQQQIVDQMVAMGYDRAKVMFLYMTLGDVDLNQMLDALNQQDDGTGDFNGMMQQERGQMTSPCPMGDHPIEVSAESLLEHIESINDFGLLRPTAQKPSPSFEDLCDESTLRKYLNCKYPPTEDSRIFVVRMAGMMAQRLSQVNYVSKVARLAEHIFVMCDLYKHFMARLPSESPSIIVDRAGVVKENDAPYGVLIDVVEAFMNNDGLMHIADRIRDPAMAIKDIGSLCSILADVSWLTRPRSLDGIMGEAADRMRAMMAEYSEKEIRDERARREIFEASRRVCKGMSPGSEGTWNSPRYAFLERLMLCGNMDAKKNAIDELSHICQHEATNSCSVRRWMRNRNVLGIILADHLDHPEYVHQIGPILQKLAPVLSERQFRTVWCLQRGRGGISLDTFTRILTNLAAGFQNDQIVMLFKYFEKQLKRSQPPVQHVNFLKATDVVANATMMTTDIEDRKLYLEYYMRLLDRFMSKTLPTCTWPMVTYTYCIRISDAFRVLPAETIMKSLGRVAKEIRDMKEVDGRFPFYFSLIRNITNHMHGELPDEFKSLGPILEHHKFAEQSTRLLVVMGQQLFEEVVKYDAFSKAHDTLKREHNAAVVLKLKQQQQQKGGPAAAAAATLAAASSAASSLQPSPAADAAAAAAAADAPPPSAVTPISNGPSPKRDGSPGGAGAQESLDSASSSMDQASGDAAEKKVNGQRARENGVKENGVERKEEASSSSVCTPPCTPEPLRVSTARPGTPEYEKELGELSMRVAGQTQDLNFRLMHYSNLVNGWQDIVGVMTGSQPVPGCDMVTLPPRVLEDMFSVMVDTTKRIGQPGLYWTVMPNTAGSFTYIKHMINRCMFAEQTSVVRSYITKLCTMPEDTVYPLHVDIIRFVVERCCKSPLFEKSTDWLEEILRCLWRLAVCRLGDVREKAVEVLKFILCERFRTLKLVTIFAVARLNEAIDTFNRFSGRSPLPHWEMGSEEREEEEWVIEDSEDDEFIEVDKENECEREEKEEKMEENGEQAVDLSLDREKRERAALDARKKEMRTMLLAMGMETEVKTREEAEFQLSRTISFLRKIVTYGYTEARCPSGLVVRDRAIPGEMCDMTLKVTAPMQTHVVSLSFPVNEPLFVFADRVQKVLPTKPPVFTVHWPRGFKVRHFMSSIHWEKHWYSVGEQLSLNNRGGVEDMQMYVSPSPFNADFETEASIKREQSTETRKQPMEETPLGCAINGTNLVPLLHALVDGGVTAGHLQDAVLHLLQQLPFEELKEERLGEICAGALQLRTPHLALYHLTTLLALLLPPNLTSDEAKRARVVFDYIRKTGFAPKFMAMIREIDRISDCLSLEYLTLFHEVCLTLIRLFYLNDSSKHRACVRNKARQKEISKVLAEVEPIDTHPIGAGLSSEEIPALLHTVCHFALAAVAPRRIDVERETSMIVPNPHVRIEMARDKKVDSHMNHRRSQLARNSLMMMIHLVDKLGDRNTNINALFNPDETDGIAVPFWRDMLMYCGSNEVQHEVCAQLIMATVSELQALDEHIAQENPAGIAKNKIVRPVLFRLVFALGTPVWGPAAAMEYSMSGARIPDHLLRLAMKVIRSTHTDEVDEALLVKWTNLQAGFISEQRPPWNARCNVSLHLQLLQELLKKIDRDTMSNLVRHAMSNLMAQALFPFAKNVKEMEETCGMLPANEAIGSGLAEGDVRKKYFEILSYYADHNPDRVMSLLENLYKDVHGKRGVQRPISWWATGEKIRRQRTESFCGPQLNLAQRLRELSAGTDTPPVRLVKGLLNPSFMCYANSVLQQLIFMPGVCEALYGLGFLEADLKQLPPDGEDSRNGYLLKNVQWLFTVMMFGAEQVQSAECVLLNIDLPSGGSVREQQDCVEFFLTLIDKCDAAAEKLNRPPIFKRFLEGTMGYEYACKTCKHRHRGVDESFTALNLEIHGGSVQESLDHFMDGALLEGASAAMCEQCGEKRTTLRIGSLRSAPTTLCIQLKRFSTYNSNGDKLNAKCDVPQELDLTRYSEPVRRATDDHVDKMFGWFDDSQDEPVVFTPPPDCPVRWRYHLVGVIVHSGQLGNGHYMSYVKERRPVMRERAWFDHWLLANDDRVSMHDDKLPMEWQGTGEENAPSAYLLWYEMIKEDEAAMIREDTVARPDQGTVSPQGTVAAVPEDTVIDEEYEEEEPDPEDLIIPEECLRSPVRNGTTVEEMEDTVAQEDTVDEEDEQMLEDRFAQSSESTDSSESTVVSDGSLATAAREAEEDIDYEEDTVEDTVDDLVEDEWEETSEDRAEDEKRMQEMIEIGERRRQAARRLKQECEWMDIGLGSLGVLEGARLDLYKCVPIHLRRRLVEENQTHQLGRDVLTESFAKWLLRLMEIVFQYHKDEPAEQKRTPYLRLMRMAKDYMVGTLFLTGDHHVHEANDTIHAYRMFIKKLLDMDLVFSVKWLHYFYDRRLKQISEDVRNFTITMPNMNGVNLWWWLAWSAIIPIKHDSEYPDLVEAYCSNMCECLDARSLRVEGFACFFHEMTRPLSPTVPGRCVMFCLKQKVLDALVERTLFYQNQKGNMLHGLQGEFTARKNLPVVQATMTLFRFAIHKQVITAEYFGAFTTTYLHLLMAPMLRHGEEPLYTIAELMLTAFRAFGDADESWIGRIAQSILTCLKTDPHRATTLFFVVTVVGKHLPPDRALDFYDEILGKRETEAAENGLLIPGVVILLENMLAERRESKLISQIEVPLLRAMNENECFREAADVYAQRINVIKIRAEEWKEQEAEENAASSIAAAAANSRGGMLMGAEAMGMLPLEACGPMARPPGCSTNGRDNYDMMTVSDDEMEDDDDEMMTDEEEYSEGEAPLNLAKNGR